MRSLCCLALATLVAGSAAALAQEQQSRLAILALDMAQEGTARAAKAAEAAALDKGWEAELVDAAGDVGAQGQGLEAILAQRKADAVLLVRTRPEELKKPLEAARGAGVPVVTVMSGADPLTTLDVTVNQFEIGARIGVHLLALMGYDGKLLMERAPGQPDTRVRGRVMDLILDENRTMQLVASLDAEPAAGEPEAMRGTLEPWLDKELQVGVEGIWTATAGQAFATDDILRAKGVRPEQVVLSTIDGGQEAFRRLRDPSSLLAATVVIPYELMGEAGVDALDDLLAGTPKEQIAAGPQMFVDTVLVDRATVPPEDEWPW
jgi:simple sugar transport system substrate-binding protein/ribose transport system substrate-binding protein